MPALGEDVELTVNDAKAPGGVRKQTWHYPSRTECRQCHNPWAGEALSFTEAQLTRPGKPDELSRLVDLGLVTWGKPKPGEDKPVKPLVNPYDAGADVQARARSYLHVNCSHCHQFGAGGSVNMDIKFDTALDDTRPWTRSPCRGRSAYRTAASWPRATRTGRCCTTGWPSRAAGGCRTSDRSWWMRPGCI